MFKKPPKSTAGGVTASSSGSTKDGELRSSAERISENRMPPLANSSKSGSMKYGSLSEEPVWSTGRLAEI